MNAEANLEFNKKRWGNYEDWLGKDQYGYRWGNGLQQPNGAIANFADRYLRPHMGDRYDHKILELSPGAGRFTAELIRYAREIHFLDMNEACLEICEERFKYHPLPKKFYKNDGQDCSMIASTDFDFIASYDSMVHMHPEVIEGYVTQLAQRLKIGGLMWCDTSGKGAAEKGHRTDMTAEAMASIAGKYSLEVVSQKFRNDHDCVSVFRRVKG